MTPIDWLWILHPALMVVIAYPLLGVVLFLARRTRLRRLGHSQLPPGSGAEHTDLGRALVAAVVAITLLALVVVIGTKASLQGVPGGPGRLVQLLLVALGTGLALAALLRRRGALPRALFALLCWADLLALGSQPEVWRLSDDPFSPAFWQSHYWGCAGLTGLLLFTLAARACFDRPGLSALPWFRLQLPCTLRQGDTAVPVQLQAISEAGVELLLGAPFPVPPPMAPGQTLSGGALPFPLAATASPSSSEPFDASPAAPPSAVPPAASRSLAAPSPASSTQPQPLPPLQLDLASLGLTDLPLQSLRQRGRLLGARWGALSWDQRQALRRGLYSREGLWPQLAAPPEPLALAVVLQRLLFGCRPEGWFYRSLMPQNPPPAAGAGS